MKPLGAVRSELSRCKATSAKLRAGRVAAPAKITSSIPPPRMAVGRFSPITQRKASSKLDFPHPLGPTTPVKPSLMTSSVGSTKLLKPDNLSLLSCNIRDSLVISCLVLVIAFEHDYPISCTL